MERVSAAWKEVKCADCGKEYQCTPEQDYYNNTTLTDGLCWDCLLKQGNMRPQSEPPYV